MSKTLYLPRADIASSNSGIGITWTKTTQRIAISGWYDGCVGIGGESLSLREFFDALGITEKDCAKAWKEKT